MQDTACRATVWPAAGALAIWPAAAIWLRLFEHEQHGARLRSRRSAPLGIRRKATLILDFTPNAVHAGIYRALAAGYYKRENIDLRVVEPTSTQETLKLIDAGKAQFGLADGSDVASLIAGGGDAQAVMALVQRPLGGLIALASEHLRSPAGLAGKTVGITGVPSRSRGARHRVARLGRESQSRARRRRSASTAPRRCWRGASRRSPASFPTKA